MAAGERAILRLSQEIAQLEGALKPDRRSGGRTAYELGAAASHVAVAAARVAQRPSGHRDLPQPGGARLRDPANGRIFLEREDTGRVVVRPPYRDVVQNALYGRSMRCAQPALRGRRGRGHIARRIRYGAAPPSENQAGVGSNRTGHRGLASSRRMPRPSGSSARYGASSSFSRRGSAAATRDRKIRTGREARKRCTFAPRERNGRKPRVWKRTAAARRGGDGRT